VREVTVHQCNELSFRQRLPPSKIRSCGTVRQVDQLSALWDAAKEREEEFTVSALGDCRGYGRKRPAIIEAPVAGETNPAKLASLAARRIKATAEELREALRGRVIASKPGAAPRRRSWLSSSPS
jgi:hypothetical protein